MHKLIAAGSLALVLVVAPLAARAETADANGDRSPALASAMSVGASLVGLGLMVVPGALDVDRDAMWVGVFAGELVAAVGPSAAHVYAGDTRHALLFSGLRAGAFVMTDVGGVLFKRCLFGASDSERCHPVPANVMLWGGLVAAVGLSMYDWWDAGDAARRTTQRTGRRLSLAPFADHRRGSLGLALAGTL